MKTLFLLLTFVASTATAQFVPGGGETVNWADDPAFVVTPSHVLFASPVVVQLRGVDADDGHVYYTRNLYYILGPIVPVPGVPQPPGPHDARALEFLDVEYTMVTFNPDQSCAYYLPPVLIEAGRASEYHCPPVTP